MNTTLNVNTMVVTYNDFAGNEIQLSADTITRFLVGDNKDKLTEQDIVLFMKLCESRKINPFLKEAYLIPYGGKAQMVVSKDFLVKRADSNEDYDGMEDGIIVVGTDGRVIERTGTFYLSNETLVGGWCKVYRKSRNRPTYKAVTLSEAGGKLQGLWEKQPAVMVNKVAISRALRDAFPNDFGGLYTRDEFNTDELEVKDSPAVEKIEVAPEMIIPAANNAEPVESEQTPDNLTASWQKHYKLCRGWLKQLDGGELTEEHKKVVDSYTDAIQNGDLKALQDCAMYMNAEAEKLSAAKTETAGE